MKKILLVEDNPDDELLTIHALQSTGIANEIIVAHDGVEALDYLLGRGEYAGRNVEELPTVMLLDLNMPRMGGLDVLRAVRAHPTLKRLPVVVLTTSKGDSDLIESYELGVNSYVRKPVDFDQFTEAARQLGMYWLLLNELPPQ